MDFKASKLFQLGCFSSTVRLWEVILALWTSKWVSASAYDRWSFMEGKKCRVLVDKLPGPQFGVRLREVPISGGSPVV